MGGGLGCCFTCSVCPETKKSLRVWQPPLILRPPYLSHVLTFYGYVLLLCTSSKKDVPATKPIFIACWPFLETRWDDGDVPRAGRITFFFFFTSLRCLECLERWCMAGYGKRIIILTAWSTFENKPRLYAQTWWVWGRAFDVGLQHVLVAQGEVRTRHVVTGSVINCLMLESTSLPALPPFLYLPPFKFISISPHLHFTAGYFRLQSLPLKVFLLFFSPPLG